MKKSLSAQEFALVSTSSFPPQEHLFVTTNNEGGEEMKRVTEKVLDMFNEPMWKCSLEKPEKIGKYTDTELIDALEKAWKKGKHTDWIVDALLKSRPKKKTIRQAIIYWIEESKK
jgi:hypothetical protein